MACFAVNMASRRADGLLRRACGLLRRADGLLRRACGLLRRADGLFRRALLCDHEWFYGEVNAGARMHVK